MTVHLQRRVVRLRGVVLAVVLAVAVVVMGGLPAAAAVDSSGAMAAMPGMTITVGTAAAADGAGPGGVPGGTTPVFGCEADCGADLAHACLAVMALVAVALAATPSLYRLITGGSATWSLGPMTRWTEGGSPPWSVLLLDQLSVLRV